MSQTIVTPLGPGTIPLRFVPRGIPIMFPPGTTMSHDAATWALYVNHKLNKSWVGYATPAGTRIVPIGGVRRVSVDMDGIDRYVAQRQAAGCSACDDDE